MAYSKCIRLNSLKVVPGARPVPDLQRDRYGEKGFRQNVLRIWWVIALSVYVKVIINP